MRVGAASALGAQQRKKPARLIRARKTAVRLLRSARIVPLAAGGMESLAIHCADGRPGGAFPVYGASFAFGEKVPTSITARRRMRSSGSGRVLKSSTLTKGFC